MNEIHSERDKLIKKLDNELESVPKNKTIDERVSEGQKIKDIK